MMMRRTLGWEVAAVLAAKLVLLFGLYFLFFDSAHRGPHDAPAVSAHLLGQG